MITRVQVKNYKSLADVDVTLGPLTVLVGKNGSGKSNFLDVLCFMRDSFRNGIDISIMNRGGVVSLRRYAYQKLNNIEITINAEDKSRLAIPTENQYGIVLSSENKNVFKIKKEIFESKERRIISNSFNVVNGKIQSHSIDLEEKTLGYLFTLESEFSDILAIRALIGNKNKFYRNIIHSYFYSIFPNTLREIQKPNPEIYLLDGGENLSSILRTIKGERFNSLLKDLSSMVKGVTNIRVRSTGGYYVTEIEREFENGKKIWHELARESDGTLRLLGLLTALHQPHSEGILTIEEPELFLHPGVLGLLADVIREASLRRQIIITTHSPDLISRFSADELRIVELVNGETKIGMLEESQREAINQELFSGGDLLRIEGLHSEHYEPKLVKAV
jgi:predicted ATPase